jgi:hypothetical protein
VCVLVRKSIFRKSTLGDDVFVESRSSDGDCGDPPKVLRGSISKSILQRPCQFLAINAHKMAPRTSKGLQERAWEAPT